MPLPLKELAKLNQIISRIQSGRFDANDIDNLLMKLRPYAPKGTVILELADFVAHSDARDRGLAQQTIASFVDWFQYFQDYVSDERELFIDEPFPAYIYRVFLSQVRLLDERHLKAEHRMSRATLIKKIESTFVVEKKTATCRLRKAKVGIELLAALKYIMQFLQPRPAFHIRDFHKELKEVMRAQEVNFDDAAWSVQTDRISLALLCLVSSAEFLLENGEIATCELETERQSRLLGEVSSETNGFGRLMVVGGATVKSADRQPLSIKFPLIDTDLDPHDHCDPGLFMLDQAADGFGGKNEEVINFAKDMSLSAEFKLVRTESLVK